MNYEQRCQAFLAAKDFKGLVRFALPKVARNFRAIGRSIGMDEVESACLVGIWRAYETHDTSKTTFLTHAYLRTRRELRDRRMFQWWSPVRLNRDITIKTRERAEAGEPCPKAFGAVQWEFIRQYSGTRWYETTETYDRRVVAHPFVLAAADDGELDVNALELVRFELTRTKRRPRDDDRYRRLAAAIGYRKWEQCFVGLDALTDLLRSA